MRTSEAKTPIRWGSVFILALGGAAVFMIPYARIIYYDPLMKALGVTNTQLGLLSSFFGLLTLICYFPGGWLADRFSAKKLLVISFLANGVLGFWYAALPGFGTVIFIHVLLGLFCSLTFWAAYVKATRRCAPPERQGLVFGVVEGARRLMSAVIGLTGSYILSRYLADSDDGIKMVLMFYGLVNLGVGLATIFFMEDDRAGGEAEFSGRLTDIRRVAANPDVWLIAAIIFSAYFSFRIQDIMTPYSTNVCGLSAALGATVASIRTYVMGGGAVLGGLVGDRLGPANTMIIGFIIIIITNLVFLLVPGSPATLAIFLGALMPFMVAHFMMRGVYYALLTEGRISLETTGLATGIIATVAYTPDVFSPLYQGLILDHFGQAGYTYIFLSSLLSCLAGLFFCSLFKRRLAARAA